MCRKLYREEGREMRGVFGEMVLAKGVGREERGLMMIGIVRIVSIFRYVSKVSDVHWDWNNNVTHFSLLM